MAEQINPIEITMIIEDDTVVQRPFGITMLLSVATAQTDKAAIYNGLEEVEDVFGTQTEEYNAAVAYYSQSPNPGRMIIGKVDPLEDIIDEYQAIEAELFDKGLNPYAVVLNSVDEQSILDLAAYINAEGKRVFFAMSDSSDVIDNSVTDDILSQLYDLNYRRVALSYTSNPSQHPNMASLGRWLAFEPGEAQLAYNTLQGVTAEKLTDNEKEKLIDKNGLWIGSLGGNTVQKNDFFVGGTKVDTMRGLDWFVARLTEDLQLLLLEQPKLVFDTDSTAIIKHTISERNQLAVNQGVFAPNPEPKTHIPNPVTDFTSAQRASGIFDGITINARVEEAILFINIRSTVEA